MFQMISMAKSLALTVFIVLLLQIKVGDSTVEEKAVFWFRSSPMVEPMQKVVDGGVKVLKTTFGKVTGLFDWKLREQIQDKPGNRDLKFRLERSRQYIREQAEHVARKMEGQLESSQEKEDSPTSHQQDWEGE